MASPESGPHLDAECMPFTFDCDFCQKTLVFDRAKDERYKNWVYATLCIQNTKEALEHLVEDIAKQIHDAIKRILSSAANCCCKPEDFDKDKRICKLCEKHKKEIFKMYNGNEKNLNWNVPLTMKQIYDSEMKVFKLFLRGKFEDCNDFKEADCTAFLSFLESTDKGIKALNGGSYLFEVRTARNKLMHSGTMRIESDKLVEYGNSCLAFLDNVNHPPGEAKGIADKKHNDIKQIINKQINIGFVEAEKVAMDHHHSHVKVEVDTLQKEIESGDLSPQELREKRETLSKVKDGLIKRGAVMEAMNMPSTNTDDVKTLVEEVEDVYMKAEKKQNDFSTKLENLQSEMKNMFQNFNTKIETEVGKLKTGLDIVMGKVISLEQHNQNEDRQTSVATTVESGDNLKSQQPPDASKAPRQTLKKSAVGDERRDDYDIHSKEVEITEINNTTSSPDDPDDQEISIIFKEDETETNDYSSEKSIEYEKEDISETSTNDPEKDGPTTIVEPSRSIEGNNVDTNGAYKRVCQLIHVKLKQLHESGMTPNRALTDIEFPLCCEKDGCFCSNYGNLLWNISRLAYNTFVSDGDGEFSSSVTASPTAIFGMSKHDLESSKKMEILEFTYEPEEIDLGSIYFVDSQQRCFFAAVHLSTKQREDIAKDIIPKLYPNTQSIKVNADILKMSAYCCPIFAMEMSKHMMNILSSDDKIQYYRKSISEDSKDTIHEIQTLLIEANKEMLHTIDREARLHINDIIVLPREVSNIGSVLCEMNIKNLKSVVLSNLDGKDTKQLIQILEDIPFIKMKLVNCEVDRMSVGFIVRDSLCVLDLRNLSMSHDIFGKIIRHLSALSLLKFMRLQNLVCSTHGQLMDECEGLIVDFTGSHKQLDCVWIMKCPLAEITFNKSAEQLQRIYLSDVKTTNTCLKSFWESLPLRSVDIWLWDVTIVLSGRRKNIIDEMRQSNKVTITLDDGYKEENGNLIVDRFEFKNHSL